MNWNNRIRQFHRWLSIIFTLGFMANIASTMFEQAPLWIGLFALIPLIALMITGLYLFALPYLAARRARVR